MNYSSYVNEKIIYVKVINCCALPISLISFRSQKQSIACAAAYMLRSVIRGIEFIITNFYPFDLLRKAALCCLRLWILLESGIVVICFLGSSSQEIPLSTRYVNPTMLVAER